MVDQAWLAWASSLPTDLVSRATRIFRAEAEDGYRDRVVIGGLSGFATNLGLAPVSELLADYASLPQEERAARLEEAASLLGKPAPPPVRRATPARPPTGITLETRIDALKGVGQVRARLYSRLGIHRVKDLLFHFPIRHEAFPAVAPIADLFFQAEGSVIGVLERLEVENLPRDSKSCARP